MRGASLTAAWMDRPQKPGLHWDRKTGGLGARVGKRGGKAWIFQKSGGARITLGQWPDMSVREAQDRARDLSERGRSNRGMTLREAFDLWATRLRNDGGSENTVTSRWSTLRTHAADWLDRPLQQISEAELRRAHAELGRRSTYSANNLMRALRTVHNASTSDPWPGRGIRLYSETARDDLIEDWGEWRERLARAESPIVRGWWRFVALTGLRKNDAITARRSNLKDGWLHVPEPKWRRPFDLPLCDAARDIVADLPEIGDWIFPGRDLSTHLKNPRVPALRRVDFPGSHILRHTYITVARLELGCPEPVVQKLVNHKPRGSVTDGYTHVTPAMCADWARRIGDHISERLTKY